MNDDPFGDDDATDAITPTSQTRQKDAVDKVPTDKKVVAEKKVAHSETSRTRSTGMAYGGKPVNAQSYPPANFPQWSSLGQEILDYDPSDELDISDVMAVNREMIRGRRRLFNANRALTAAQRDAAEKKFLHRRARNRYLLGITGGTEKLREAQADVATEAEYGEMIVAEQVSNDLLNQSRSIKAELDSLANLSHNIRAQMSLQ